MRAESVLEQLYFTTARIEASGPTGASVGTGFIYTVHAEGPQLPGGGGTVHLLATNKHVLEGASQLVFHMIQSQEDRPALGSAWVATLDGVSPELWMGHPDPDVDVAVVPFSAVLNHMQERTGTTPFVRGIAPELALSASQAAELDAVEDIVFIGYPRGLYDSVNLLPVMRRGTTASPIGVDYEGGPKFMIDASVFPGSSGSPVFIVNNGAYGTRAGDIVVGGRVIFVGIVAASHIYKDIADVIPLPTEDRRAAIVEAFLNLGIVFKASALDETVDNFLSSHGHRRVAQPATDSAAG